jgi:hypothetical protein
MQHRSKTLEERGIFMDIDEPSLLNARGEKFVTRLYMAPLSKKPRPLSADNTPARTSGFAFLPPHMSDDRMTTAPPAYQPSWAQAQARRTRPSSPAGPRGHRPRPISSPPPVHTHAHTSFAMTNMTHPNDSSSPSHARTFYGGARSPPAAPYAEQLNPFVASAQAHSHEHTTGYVVPLGPIAPSPLSGTLPPVSAPRISNATFQRTIDDIAGRMNMLNAAFARAQIQARADAAHAQARYRALPMLGQYPAPAEAEPDKGPAHPPAASGRDKENASVEQGPSGRRRSSAGYAAEDGQVLNGLGFSKANGSGVLRKEIGNIAVPPEAVTVTRTKKDRKSGKRKSTFHTHHSSLRIYPSPFPPQNLLFSATTTARARYPRFATHWVAGTRLAQIIPTRFTRRRRGQRLVLKSLPLAHARSHPTLVRRRSAHPRRSPPSPRARAPPRTTTRRRPPCAHRRCI